MLPMRLLVVLLALPAALAWIRVDRECEPGCTERGNCNKETGKCDCPPGWTGPTCKEANLGACRTTLAPNHIVGHHGTEWPKACECLRQIDRLFTLPVIPELSSDPWLDNPVLKDWDRLVCFERTALGAEQQYSDLPDVDEQGVAWFRGKKGEGGKREFEKLDARPARLKRDGDMSEDYRPLKYCKDRCMDRGACYGRTNATSGGCRCSRGYRGSACEDVNTDHMERCKGKLVAGWCHCEPGKWGRDCTRSAAWGPDPSKPEEVRDKAYSRTRVRIYRYELPWTVSWPQTGSGNEEIQNYDGLYQAEDLFLRGLVNDPEVLTENPYEANLFYVTTDNMYYGGNIWLNIQHIKLVTHWVKQNYPTFFNRRGAKDHIISCMADWGSCQLTDGFPARMIKLSLWGPQENSKIREEHADGVYSRTYSSGCFNPSRDVVLPVRLDPGGSLEILQRAPELYKAEPFNRPGYNRTYLIYFGGDIRYHNKDYSAGSRQAFYDHFTVNGTSKYPDEVKFLGNGPEYALQSHFCLILGGEGFPSTRLTVAMHTACIPVIIMDHIHQPFHDILPYRSFSVRVPHEDIPNLLTILRGIPDEERARLRRNMARYYSHFNWWPETNGTAYRTTIRALTRRVHNLWGWLYKKQ